MQSRQKGATILVCGTANVKDKADKSTENPEHIKLAVVVSHPIQYFAPYYRAVATEGSVQVKVFFCSRIGVDEILDPGMGAKFSWKTDLLSGYEHEFLPEAPTIKNTGFREVNNPSITTALKAFGPDVVLLHAYAQKTMLRALCWAWWRGVPALMISDNTGARSRNTTGPLGRYFRTRLLRHYGALLTMSEPLRGQAVPPAGWLFPPRRSRPGSAPVCTPFS